MEKLKYSIDDSTIARLLGDQNFTNDESAVLELVKNAYDAKALSVTIMFEGTSLTIIDDGIGMNKKDVKSHWMHVGKSNKEYEIKDSANKKRILAGSKGIGRFALSRLGENVEVFTKKVGSVGVVWSTDWNNSQIDNAASICDVGTKIVINNLRIKWTKKTVENLRDFLSKTYNDTSMKIKIVYLGTTHKVNKYFSNPQLGINCRSSINLSYNNESKILTTTVHSDEFSDEAKQYCPKIDLKQFISKVNIADELKNSSDFDLSIDELSINLTRIGKFFSELYFNINSDTVEMDKFLYKYSKTSDNYNCGIILYRNAFSISAYEGKKDWLGFGRRSRKSPAAASHPTGAWRVRENQLTGKVVIDKKENAVLQELSNRQGFDENIFYQLFVEIILIGVKEFERYRQSIIRLIDTKNGSVDEDKATPVSDKIVSNPTAITKLSKSEARQLMLEIKTYRKESGDFKREKAGVEERYKYDVRILNVLATTGLKASSIAHEMHNDRNAIVENSDNIIRALKEYKMWEELNSLENTKTVYKNVPKLIRSNIEISKKIVTFMDTMLADVEKNQFESKLHCIADLLGNIKTVWERDYSWVTINVEIFENIILKMSEDIIRVIFDNLILNSIQQNGEINKLIVKIHASEKEGLILFSYSDNGVGLDRKYASAPRKILEVHETTRSDGHGLGMWIVNNTSIMSGGEIYKITGDNGFCIEFSIGGKL